MKITMSAARRNAGFSQTYVAEEMGVTVVTLSNWETGKTKPSKASVKMFASICGIDESLIFLPSDLKEN